MRLTVFDLDGTLTATGRADSECFVAALAAAGLTEIDQTWGDYAHTTDSGITNAVFMKHIGRPAMAAELLEIKACFGELLEARARSFPKQFRAIPGAARMLSGLRDRGEAVAIATGAWEISARVKLRHAGLETLPMPLASADDAEARVDIISHAIERARRRYGVRAFADIVLVGDAPWDLRAAAALGHPFVGLGFERDPDVLRAAGAEHVVTDYTQPQRFFAAVESATEAHRLAARRSPGSAE